MPGVLGGIASMFAIAIVANEFEKDYFPVIAAGGSKSGQVMAQVYMVLVTLGLAILTGYFGGLIVKRNIFSPPQILFKDDEHFDDVVSRYQESYHKIGATENQE